MAAGTQAHKRRPNISSHPIDSLRSTGPCDPSGKVQVAVHKLREGRNNIIIYLVETIQWAMKYPSSPMITSTLYAYPVIADIKSSASTLNRATMYI